MGVLNDFKSFIMKGNVIDMAVGVVIGLAFSALVSAVVADIVTPLVGVPGHLNFAGWTFMVNGSLFQPGDVLNKLISFLLIAVVIFFGVVLPIARLEERRKARLKAAPPTTRDCPYCLSTIPIKASKCMNCTSEVPPVK